ncbi:ImmA/IrrE family metallo-endopeptidase [Rhodoferax antarcticus]|uniref:ImmA/IrrE family metallo-endopeptidase n=1 Tax=Rhodoferax antarcticus TaxID=81479 RepID=UPI0011153820|nr:ImmA/IrrE family metallo-endopeptidase [Rhodoferax antarcticus]
MYDVMDTEGDPLPTGVSAFEAAGVIDQTALDRFAALIEKKDIFWKYVDMGDLKAGSIARLTRTALPGEKSAYKMRMNQNHNPNVQFATLAHELAHLFLGHLGQDKYLSIPIRPTQTHTQQELEAESTAYIVCTRNGVENQSASYLKNYVEKDTTTERLDMYQIMRAAGQVETLLGLAAHTKVDKPQKKRNETLPLFPSNSPDNSPDLFETDS